MINDILLIVVTFTLTVILIGFLPDFVLEFFWRTKIKLRWHWSKPKIGEYYVLNDAFYKKYGTNPFEDLQKMIYVKVIDVKDGWIKFEDCKDAFKYRSMVIEEFMEIFTIPSQHASKMIVAQKTRFKG